MSVDGHRAAFLAGGSGPGRAAARGLLLRARARLQRRELAHDARRERAVPRRVCAVRRRLAGEHGAAGPRRRRDSTRAVRARGAGREAGGRGRGRSGRRRPLARAAAARRRRRGRERAPAGGRRPRRARTRAAAAAWLCARRGSRRARALLAPLRAADRATYAALATWVGGTVLARIAAAALTGAALGVPHPLAAALLVVPALELAGVVSVLPANAGLAGGAAAFAFHVGGLPAREALAAGFVLHGVETATGLLVGSVCAGALSWHARHRFVTGRFPGRSPQNGGPVAASGGLSAIRQQGGTMRNWTRRLALVAVTAAIASLAATAHAAVRGDGDGGHRDATRTPIQHLVVIFQENVSFDHYFGTYPNAANTDGQPFAARRRTRPRSTASRRRRPSHPAGPAAQHRPDRDQPELVAADPARHAARTAPGATATASSPATRTTTTATSSRPWTAA